MRITELRELTVPLEGAIENAVVSFAGHNVSLVEVRTDMVRRGRPVSGMAFNSIGRFGQAGILRERFFPRLLAADPEISTDKPAYLIVKEHGEWNGFATAKCVLKCSAFVKDDESFDIDF